jgi:hypothetical protein
MQGPGLQKASDCRRFSAQRLRLVCDRFSGWQFGRFGASDNRGCPGWCNQRRHRINDQLGGTRQRPCCCTCSA